MASFTRVRARATIHHGHKNGVEIVKSGEEIELETHEAERLHKARLADIIGEPTERMEEPPPLQNAKGKKSGDGKPAGADGTQNTGGADIDQSGA